MIYLIDNYDSFTWNLWHCLSDLGARVQTIRNDLKTADEIIAEKPDAIVISPGPETPDKAGICIELIAKAAAQQIPLLGICLGHQAIAAAFGGAIMPINPPVHGKLSFIKHDGKHIFQKCDETFAVTRYHSLVINPETLPSCLNITATTPTGTIMAIQHKTAPIYGLQFHPESIASENGYRILANFLKSANINPQTPDEQIRKLEARALNLSQTHPEHIHH